MSQLYPIGALSLPRCARFSKKDISTPPFSVLLLSATLLTAASADTFIFTGDFPQIFVASMSGIDRITTRGASGGNEQYKYYGEDFAAFPAPEAGTFTLLGTGAFTLFASYRRSRG